MSQPRAPRIVSLLPSATEIAVAIGCGDALVGRSHECDVPAGVERLPVCTATKLEKGLTARQVEDRVQEIVRQGLSVYEVDAERLKALKPDIILTQSQCAVCAVTPRDLEEALASWVGTPPVLLSLAPDTLADVWGDIRRVGEVAGADKAAAETIVRLEARLERLRAKAARRDWRPRVAAVEWMDPLMAAGNWVPELIEAAGGAPLFAAAGQHSPWLEWDALREADPDVIVLMPCGCRIPQVLDEMPAMTGRPGWRDLKAVRSSRVYAVDGHHYFSRPGPGLVESAEVLDEIFDDARDPRGVPTPRWRQVELSLASGLSA
ncbi:cobalamin-binding protein [Phenylobacterium sp.]|uniref:cobalamin-binding protein n=1 Tax=Phenylobacterium sp. TaxID=1871053 RepID=UPI00120B3F22|nr:cobalamin-binding protein [Phenylobacterium sp.]THD58097.1 MAG: cobalamin-binding protein [Phenylobacterium sp.]